AMWRPPVRGTGRAGAGAASPVNPLTVPASPDIVGASPAVGAAARAARGAARPRLHRVPARRADRCAARSGPARLVLAVDPHEEEDRAAGDGRGDDGGGARDADRPPEQPDVDTRTGRPR